MNRWGKSAASGVSAIGLVAVTAIAMNSSSKLATSAKTTAEPAVPAPMALARQGYFYAGGRYDKDHPDQHIVGQVYVGYRIPQNLKHPLPIVMVHGGGVHGATWLSTPDGREGWADRRTAHCAIHVVVQPGDMGDNPGPKGLSRGCKVLCSRSIYPRS